MEIDLITAREAAYDNIGRRLTRWAATIVFPLVPAHPSRLLGGQYARATAQQRFHVQPVEFYNFPMLSHQFDVFWPRLTAAAGRLSTGLRHTALRLCGTAFVAVSTLDFPVRGGA